MSNLTRTDVEQVVDYALGLAQAQAAKTSWKWDDKVVSWVIAGKDGFVTMICRMFGIPTALDTSSDGALVFMPQHAGPVSSTSLGLDDPTAAGLKPETMKLLQFILNILAKWIGPITPVTPPKE